MPQNRIPLEVIASDALNFRWTLQDLSAAEARFGQAQATYKNEAGRWTDDTFREMFNNREPTIADLRFKKRTGRTPAEAAEEARVRKFLEAVGPAEQHRDELRQRLAQLATSLIDAAFELNVPNTTALLVFRRTWSSDDLLRADVIVEEIASRVSLAMRQAAVPLAAAARALACLVILPDVESARLELCVAPPPPPAPVERDESGQPTTEYMERYDAHHKALSAQRAELARRRDELRDEVRLLAAPLLAVSVYPQINMRPSDLRQLLESWGPHSKSEARALESARTFLADLSLKLAVPTIAAALTSPCLLQQSSVSEEKAKIAVFEKRGPVRQIVFGGREEFVVNFTGCDYLEYLLMRPGEECPVVDVWASTLDKPELAALVTGRGEAVLNGPAWAEAKRKFHELVADRDAAKARGDVKGQLTAQNAMAALGAQMEAAKGVGGRDRRIDDDAQRLTNAVREAIGRAMRDIAGQHEELGKHLKRHVKRGQVLRYDPEPPVHWQV